MELCNAWEQYLQITNQTTRETLGNNQLGNRWTTILFFFFSFYLVSPMYEGPKTLFFFYHSAIVCSNLIGQRLIHFAASYRNVLFLLRCCFRYKIIHRVIDIQNLNTISSLYKSVSFFQFIWKSLPCAVRSNHNPPSMQYVQSEELKQTEVPPPRLRVTMGLSIPVKIQLSVLICINTNQ